MNNNFDRQKVEALIYFKRSEILPRLEKILNNLFLKKPADPIAYIVN